jgi:biotin synthase-like enzyme
LSGKKATDREIEFMVEAAKLIKERFPQLKLCFSAGTLTAPQIKKTSRGRFR